MMSGWVAVHRQAIDSAVFQDANLWHLFSWLLLRASRNGSNVSMRTGRGKTIVELKPGQCIVGRNRAAESLGCAPTTLRDRLKRLEAMKMVSVEPGSHWSIVTVTNWSEYQPKLSNQPPPNRHPNHAANYGTNAMFSNGGKAPVRQATATQTPPNRQATATNNKEDKEGKEENYSLSSFANDVAANGKGTRKNSASNTKARRYTPEFTRWWATYWNNRGKSEAAKAFVPALARIVDDPDVPVATDTQTALTWLIDRTQRYARQLDEATEKLHGATYLNQDRYQDDLEPRRPDRGVPMQQPLSRRRFS